MSLWRLEWLRLVRTKRWIALLGVYLLFGFVGPLTARYLAEIVTLAGGELEGATIEFPPPVPADGMAQYVSNAMQIGTLVAVVVAAGALAFDAIPEMGVFLRTRIEKVRDILAPRFVVTTGAVIVAFLLGAVAAWYETWALIGSPGTTEVLVGMVYGALFLVFVVALVAAVASQANSVLGTVMVSIVILLVMPILGSIGSLGDWLPTHLASALAALPAGGAATDYVGAAAISLVASGLLLWLSVSLARQREL
jgi:ABC-2 type transport system permease protein